MLAIAPVNNEITTKSPEFNVKLILLSNKLPIMNETTAYINAVRRNDIRLLQGFFLVANELPAKTPRTVAAIADGKVYISGKSVKQRNSAVIISIIKVTVSDIATDFKMPVK